MYVTPFVGVWIETKNGHLMTIQSSVTPFVGVWIETRNQDNKQRILRGHTLRGCVD